jgi:hypothetical protein
MPESSTFTLKIVDAGLIFDILKNVNEYWSRKALFSKHAPWRFQEAAPRSRFVDRIDLHVQYIENLEKSESFHALPKYDRRFNAPSALQRALAHPRERSTACCHRA